MSDTKLNETLKHTLSILLDVLLLCMCVCDKNSRITFHVKREDHTIYFSIYSQTTVYAEVYARVYVYRA